jgi:hypothetical protein
MKNTFLIFLLFIGFNAYSQNTMITEFKLKNGYSVKGNIIDSIPNKSYKIKTLKGVEQIYTLEEIEKISRDEKKENNSTLLKLNRFDIGLDYGYTYSNATYIGNSNRLNLNAQFHITDNFVIGMNCSRQNFNMEKTFDATSSLPPSRGEFNTTSYGFYFSQYLTKRKLKPYFSIEFGKIFWSYFGHAQVQNFYNWNDFTFYTERVVAAGNNIYFSPVFGVSFEINNKINLSTNVRYMFDVNNNNNNDLTKVTTYSRIYDFNHNLDRIETLNASNKFNMLSINFGISFSIRGKK